MRLRKGQVVRVDFLDHCEGGNTPLLCSVWGKIRLVNPQHITICCWESTDSGRPSLHNDTTFNILRSTIKGITHFTN